MHRTYSGNYSFFNALTFSVISSELMQPQTEAPPLRKPERVWLSTAPLQRSVSLCAPAMWEDPDHTALQTHSCSHQSHRVLFIKKNKQSSTQKNLLFLWLMRRLGNVNTPKNTHVFKKGNIAELRISTSAHPFCDHFKNTLKEIHLGWRTSDFKKGCGCDLDPHQCLLLLWKHLLTLFFSDTFWLSQKHQQSCSAAKSCVESRTAAAQLSKRSRHCHRICVLSHTAV